MFLIVGLGNPGKKYQDTYHNVGFLTLDAYAQEKGVSLSKKKSNAMIYEGQVDGQKVILAKPQTFMNLSGQSVSHLISSFKIDHSKVLIIYDDVDLELGAVRFRKEGSGGTHNGMKHIIEQVGINQIPRIRIGIGQPMHGGQSLSDFVLCHMGKAQLQEIDKAIEIVKGLIDEFISKNGEIENKSK